MREWLFNAHRADMMFTVAAQWLSAFAVTQARDSGNTKSYAYYLLRYARYVVHEGMLTLV